jgi:hypothetical protein
VLFLYRSAVACAISELCLRVSGYTVKGFAIEWLLAIPLYHFLDKMSEPYGKTKLSYQLNWILYNTKFGLVPMSAKAQKEKE